MVCACDGDREFRGFTDGVVPVGMVGDDLDLEGFDASGEARVVREAGAEQSDE